MFDFHMHSLASADSEAGPEEMAAAAKACGMREICFTDHLDCKPGQKETNVFTQEAYEKAYGNLRCEGLVIRLGMEFGMQSDNRERFIEECKKRKYDFIIGSVHSVGGESVYQKPYWETRTQREAYTQYLEEILACLEVHRDFHVLGHLTYPSKCPGSVDHSPYTMKEYGELAEEIFRRLIDLGIGLEINTSGVRCSKKPLPPLEFIKRYIEMGGEIVTIGSDAHRPAYVGNYIFETLKSLRDFTPWITTFAEGKPVFHKID